MNHGCRNILFIADRIGMDMTRVVRGLFPRLDVKQHSPTYHVDVGRRMYDGASPIARLRKRRSC